MANKYGSPAGGNWSTSGTWVTTSGGSTVTTAPTTSDVAILDANSGPVTTDATTNVAQQLNCTNYANTLTVAESTRLSITTNITFSAGMTYAGTGRLRAGAGTATLNFANKTITGDFEFFGTGTKTLTTNAIVTGITYMSASPTINTNRWYAVGGIEATTAANKIFYGSTELWVQGGRYYYITKRTGGKLVFDGNVTLQSEMNTATMGIYDSTLAYNSGTITVAANTIFNINGNSTIEASVGSNIIFDNLDMSGTLTLNCDLYSLHSIACIGATSVTVNGAYTIHVGYGGGTSNIIMYNLGTFISTTAKISFEGTGNIFTGVSYNGMTYAPLSALQIDLDINTAGTATFYSTGGTINRFGGLGTLKYVKGTVVTTNCIFSLYNGNYFFDINNNFTIPTFRIETVNYAGILSDMTVSNLLLVEGSTVSITDTKTLTVENSMILNGADASVITINETSGSGTAYLTYNGTLANCKIYKGAFTDIDASNSAVKLFTWYGTASSCINIKAVTGSDIRKTSGVVNI